MNIEPYLTHMAEKGASDMFFTTGAPPSVKIQGVLKPLSKTRLQPGATAKIADALMSEEQRNLFAENLEMNLGLSMKDYGRFRINIYRQRGEVSLVIRYINSQIPSFEELNLPESLSELVMYKTGLVLLVGSTGSGKSTSLASMLNYRNHERADHILTVEDPIEFTYNHARSIVGQREVGIDTKSYENALREAMREAPDVILIGEIRDKRTMEAALGFADTGHLVLSSLHAVNANQALDRIINFFPPEGRNHILMDLSLNLRGIVSQRLLIGVEGTRIPAVEVMLNSTYISELIKRGEIGEIKEIMEKSSEAGMQTFDASLFELFKNGSIDRETALTNADSRTNLEWRMNFGKQGNDTPDYEPTDNSASEEVEPGASADEDDNEELLASLTSYDSYDDSDMDGFLDDLTDYDESKVD